MIAFITGPVHDVDLVNKCVNQVLLGWIAAGSGIRYKGRVDATGIVEGCVNFAGNTIGSTLLRYKGNGVFFGKISGAIVDQEHIQFGGSVGLEVANVPIPVGKGNGKQRLVLIAFATDHRGFA